MREWCAQQVELTVLVCTSQESCLPRITHDKLDVFDKSARLTNLCQLGNLRRIERLPHRQLVTIVLPSRTYASMTEQAFISRDVVGHRFANVIGSPGLRHGWLAAFLGLCGGSILSF
jgi:hypothetical protein